MLKKAHTNEEFTAVALALPDRETQDLWWPTTENPSSSITEPKTPLGQVALIKVADGTEPMMGSRAILTHNNLQGKSEFKLQCNLHFIYIVEQKKNNTRKERP